MIRFTLTAVLAILCVCAQAQPYIYAYKTKDVEIRLLGAVCTQPGAVAVLGPHSKLPLRAAEVRHRDGRQYDACWVLLEDGNVFLATPRKEIGTIPSSKFEIAGT